jgi:hypothetical protein
VTLDEGFLNLVIHDVFAITGTTAALTLTDYVIGLPGGITLNRQQASNTVNWSYSNVHGDLLMVASDAGTKQGSTYFWDPDGLPAYIFQGSRSSRPSILSNRVLATPTIYTQPTP